MQFGLVGKTLKHSFSKSYFTDRFDKEQLSHSYENFELADISQFKNLLQNQPQLKGLNVTVPYKESIIPYLDKISPEAFKIGAVNTISFKNELLVGHNTDVYGFEKSLTPLLQAHHTQALILGTGGASKAVQYVLDKLGISFTLVSRNPNDKQYSYTVASNQLDNNYLIINTTPLGTFPKLLEQPALATDHLSTKHLVYDLIYNPAETVLLQKAKLKGATIKNGLEMLQFQANKSWEIWNEY